MRYLFLCGVMFLGLTAWAGAEPPPGTPTPPAPEPVPVIKLAVTVGAPKTRALKYTLLPDPLDLTPGNAAPLWIRAGNAFQPTYRSLVEGQYKGRGGPAGTPLNFEGKHLPLKELPLGEIRAYLAHFGTALRLADQAAHCDHCDWEFPPFKIQDFDFPLEEIQHLRSIAALLQMRIRLELSEGRFDDAVHTLQIGFALGRDAGKGNTLIQDLVGIAIGAIMFNNVEEWMQTPGSPNLFWALTDLPRPLVDTAPAMHSELTTLFRSFPPLRQLVEHSEKGPMSEEETNQIVADLFKTLSSLEGSQMPDWQKKLGVAAVAVKVYPEARKYLLERGRKPEQLDAMPAMQVVLLYYVGEYDEIKDEILKWMNVAPWQAQAGLDNVSKGIRAQGAPGNLLVRLLMPAVEKVYEAHVRIERAADYLRCAEALRMYAATHDGKAPEKLDDVKLPLPLDPYTGQGFDKFYKVMADGTAVFEIPPPTPIASPLMGRRFELRGDNILLPPNDKK
jgi:hypothetical protein